LPGEILTDQLFYGENIIEKTFIVRAIEKTFIVRVKF